MKRPVLVPCDACQSEGRILTNDGGPDDSDHGPCLVCEGTGLMLVEDVEMIEVDDLDMGGSIEGNQT